VPPEIKVGIIGIARDEISAVLGRSGNLVAVPTSDIDAAAKLQRGELQYIIGACESGGGAALAIPIAVLGTDRCQNLSRLGRPAGTSEIHEFVHRGVKAFGVARDHVDDVVPALIEALPHANDNGSE
jgi:hypothetical protein